MKPDLLEDVPEAHALHVDAIQTHSSLGGGGGTPVHSRASVSRAPVKLRSVSARPVAITFTGVLAPDCRPSPHSGTPRRWFHATRWIGLASAAAVAGVLAIGMDPMRVRHYEAVETDRTIDCRNNHIILHRQSRMAIQCGPNLLRARLVQGEASFQVARDDSSSTIVLAGDARVDAVGTTFLVRRDPDQSIVTVLGGGGLTLSALNSGGESSASRSAVQAGAPNPVRTTNEMPVWPGERAAVVNSRSAVLLGSSRKLRIATSNEEN